MSKKKTPWFPSSIKPVRAGVYEVFTPNALSNNYAYFDKNGWRLCASDIQTAEKEKTWLFQISNSSMCLPKSLWRGFTENQS